jgi:ornithine carbamoyltransferase
MADLLTIEEHRGRIAGKTVAWIGDGNNVCASFMHAAPLLGFTLTVACPDRYRPSQTDIDRAQGAVRLFDAPGPAVEGADVVVTDTWVSMGDQDKRERMAALSPFQVDDALMDRAGPNAVFLHCLPAHRDEEVTTAVIDGPRSLIWDEAENRIHAQKSVLAWCFGAIG